MPQTFDQDAYVDALEPPVYVAGGRTHRGVILSADEFFAFVDRIKAGGDQRAQIREFFDLVFPPLRPRWWWWVLRDARPRSVAEYVAELPLGGQLEAFKSFSAAQARMNGIDPAPTTETSGTGSPS